MPRRTWFQIADARSVNAAATRRWLICFGGEFVVAPAQVLHELSPVMMIWTVRSVRQAAHGSQPVFESAVIGLDALVFIAFDVMPRGGNQRFDDPQVDRRSIGDDVGRRHLQRGQRPAEEQACGVAVAPFRHHHDAEHGEFTTEQRLEPANRAVSQRVSSSRSVRVV